MYDNLILIHTPPVEHQENTVTIHTVLSVPKFLQAALYLKDYKVWMESEDGLISAPLGSVIGYEKSEKTYSGYNCWPIGCLGSDLIRIDGLLYRNPYVAYGMLIPGPNDHIALPLWVQRCKLVYNEDGQLATVTTGDKNLTGRVGKDWLISYGMSRENGIPNAAIISADDERFDEYMVCDELTRKVIGKLADYPFA